MNAPDLNPDSLRRLLQLGQFRLPLTHAHALEVVARLHGYRSWNAASASSALVEGLKVRAKTFRRAISGYADVASLGTKKLNSICAAMNAVPLDRRTEKGPEIAWDKISAEERDLLGLLGAGASTAELKILRPPSPGVMDVRLLGIGFKIHAHTDPARDAFAREHHLVQREHLDSLLALRKKRPRPRFKPSTLNLKVSITVIDFQNLVAAQDDDAGHHVLWVDRQGWIHLDRLPDGIAAGQYEAEIDCDMQIRYETFIQGNGYVGPQGAADFRRMGEILETMKGHWAVGAAGYCDVF